MSEFKDELYLILSLAYEDGKKNNFKLSEHSVLKNDEFIKKYEPKPLPVIPQFVADEIEREKSNENDFENIFLMLETSKKFGDWFTTKKNETLMRAWLYGYTVEKDEKEKKFLLKNRMTNLFLLKVVSTNEPTHFEEVENEYDNIIRDDGALIMQFTQEEIDNMETGSYEQIEVDK